jgi:hypothetical protein
VASADWWQDCAVEREKLCRGVPAGGGRVADCIDRHASELSPRCHEGAPQGSPPWSLTLVGDRYQAQLRDGARVQTRDIGGAAQDRGRWVQWMLRYRPDSSGAGAITELERDGARVLSANGVPNAYPNDNRAYFKIGIYKWWWKERPSNVSERTIFFGDVFAEVR